MRTFYKLIVLSIYISMISGCALTKYKYVDKAVSEVLSEF